MTRPTQVQVVTIVAAAAPVVFDLELDVDVHAASLAGSGERATTPHGRRSLRLGDDVAFSARHLWRAWTLTSRITEFDRPRRFVDEQVSGPFRSMRHEHLFDPDGVGTRMVDRFSFTLPGGFVGALVGHVVAGPYLRRLLVRRGRHIARAAEARR